MLQLDCADGRIESGILSEGGGGMGDVSLFLVQIERERTNVGASPPLSSSYSAAAGLRQTDLVCEGLAPATGQPTHPPHPAARAKPSPPTDRLACMHVPCPAFHFLLPGDVTACGTARRTEENRPEEPRSP